MPAVALGGGKRDRSADLTINLPQYGKVIWPLRELALRIDTLGQRPAAAAGRIAAPAVQAPAAAALDRGECEGELPPEHVGPHERRMQVRAYELWIALLGAHRLPAIADLRPGDHPALAPFGVLLDVTCSPHDPRIAFLGDSLAAECGVQGDSVSCVSCMPERSLLVRIARHYLKALVSPEPIGFEAEFVNQRAKTILYRGILLPFSRGGGTIDFVFGVINWKEEADCAMIEDLLAELGQAIHDAADDAQAEPAEGPAPDAAAQALAQLPTGSKTKDPMKARTRMLPALAPLDLAEIDASDAEFALVAVACTPAGAPVVLGEVKRGSRLYERAAGRLPN